MSERRRIRLRVDGRVQGVGFRRFVELRARAHGVRGWVRNLVDGSVEIEAEGDDAALATLRRDVRRGPPGAVVRDVTETPAGTEELAPEFEVRRDLRF